MLGMPTDPLQEIAARYRSMSESELLAFAQSYDELSDPAQRLLREEFELRSLQPPLLEDSTEPDVEQQPMVTVGTYRDLPEAVVARAMLEAEGISCFLANENTVRMDWFWSNLLGGMRLQVGVEDQARAAELLAQPIPSSFEMGEGEKYTQPVCPVCSSLDISAEDGDRKVLAASMLIGLPLPHRKPPESRWRCQTCGTHWEDSEGGAGPA
jgi:hypothetical protein